MTTSTTPPAVRPDPAPAPAKAHTHIWLVVLGFIIIAGMLLWQMGWFSSKPRLALVTSGDTAYWDPVLAGAEEAARVYDVDLNVLRIKTDVGAQTQAIRDLMGKGYKGIAVSPISPEFQAGLLSDVANETGLVTFDSDSPVSRRLSFVGTDNYHAGRLLGERIRVLLPDGGGVIIVLGNFDKENTQHRRQGVIDELLDRDYQPNRPIDPADADLKGAKYSILATIADTSDPQTCTQMTLQALKNSPDVKCFAGLLGYSAPSILKALREAGQAGKVQLVGFDVAADTLDGIDAGTVAATIMQDQYGCGFHAVRILAENARGDRSGLPLFQRRTLPVELVTKENVAAIRAQLSGTANGSASPAPPATTPVALNAN